MPFAVKRHALRLAVAYALVAGLWIALSDRMLGGIADPALAMRVSMLKGFAFVAVTAVALYLLLHFGSSPPGDELPSAGKRSLRLLLTFLLLAVVIAVVGFLAYRVQAEILRQAAEDELKAVADLKAGQISSWLAERRADAAVQARDALIEEALRRWRDGDERLKSRLAERLEMIRRAYDYAGVELLDRDGEPLLVAGQPSSDVEYRRLLVKRILNRATPLLNDFHRHGESGRIHLSFIAAIVGDEEREPPLGAILLTVDPARFLYPLILSWPGRGTSGETLLVRQEGGDVLYLSELRYRRDAALRLRLPLSQPGLPAARAILGGPEVMAGLDYRGVPVLAANRAVSHTPWYVVAKLDRAEVFDGIEHLGVTVGLLVLAAILVSGMVAALLWRHQRLQEALVQAGQQRALDQAELRFRATFEQAAVGVFHMSPEGRFLRVNRRFADIIGQAADQLEQLGCRDITHPDDLAEQQRLTDELLAGRRDSYAMDKRYLRQDGGIVWGRLTMALVRTAAGEPDFLVGVVEEISARKASEQRLARLDRLYQTRAEIDQAIIRASDAKTLFEQTCQTTVQLGGFSTAWVCLHDPATAMLAPVAAAGERAEALYSLAVPLDPAVPGGHSLTARAFLRQSRMISNDYETDMGHTDWRRLAAQHRVAAVLALPLRRQGQVIGVFSVGAGEPNYFDMEIVRLFDEIATDLSFALDHLDHPQHPGGPAAAP